MKRVRRVSKKARELVQQRKSWVIFSCFLLILLVLINTPRYADKFNFFSNLKKQISSSISTSGNILSNFSPEKHNISVIEPVKRSNTDVSGFVITNQDVCGYMEKPFIMVFLKSGDGWSDIAESAFDNVTAKYDNIIAEKWFEGNISENRLVVFNVLTSGIDSYPVFIVGCKYLRIGSFDESGRLAENLDLAVKKVI